LYPQALFRGSGLQNDLFCVEWDVKPYTAFIRCFEGGAIKRTERAERQETAAEATSARR